MGAISCLIFIIWILVLGLNGIGFSIAGIIVFSIFSRKGKRFAKPLKIVSIVLLIVSSLITVVPVGFFGIIVAMNVLPPEDYVETDVVIEENGYQDVRFTADGKVYEVLYLYVDSEDYIGKPIFSYKTSGILNGSQCGNYYLVENPNNYNLVCDWAGLLFAPVDEKKEVLEYYLSLENLDYYFVYGMEQKVLIDDSFGSELSLFLSEDLSNKETTTFILETADTYEIETISKDGLIHISTHSFLCLNNSVYYIYESSFEDSKIKYTVIPLDEQLKAYFIKLITNL